MRVCTRQLICFVLLAVSACADTSRPASEPRVVYQQVKVAVPVGCVVNAPPKVVSVRDQDLQPPWDQRALGAKAETIKAQAGERMNYESKLEAATAGCKPVSSN